MWKDMERFKQNFEKAKGNEPVRQIMMRCVIGNNKKNPYRSEQIDYIISQIEDINKKVISEYTLLGMACRLQNIESIKLLLEKGADPNRISRVALTPIMITFIQEDNEIKKGIIIALLKAGVSLKMVESEKYQDLYELAKRFKKIPWLYVIEENKNLLNKDQKKEWNRIRLKLLFS